MTDETAVIFVCGSRYQKVRISLGGLRTAVRGLKEEG
jgi:hypothetical protein